jgi:hypothetical protein
LPEFIKPKSKNCPHGRFEKNQTNKLPIMKLIKSTNYTALARRLPFKKVALLLLLTFPVSYLSASLVQDPCDIFRNHGQGYRTSIASVTLNQDESHTITLLVSNDGCAEPGCKGLSHYSVQALPGTYSNISVEVVSGSMTYTSIDMGPNLGADPIMGFKINGIDGIGGGVAGEFKVTYTLTGGLQNQKALAKAGPNRLIVSFIISHFQSILECGDVNIYPYYEPPVGGKLESSLIGPELTSLHGVYINSGPVVSDNIFRVDEENVLIRVFALPAQLPELLNILISEPYGLTEEIIIPDLNAITGWFPVANLLLIDTLDTYVNYARPEYPPQSNSGLVTSQGDISMRSDFARDVFNVSGAGAKVGVLSDSYNKKFGDPANDDVLKGDLPGIATDPNGNLVPNPLNDTDVDVLKDYPYIGSDEGRAMLQIIHDIAPEANLAFRTGFINPVDFAAGIIELKDAGCNVIVDDITYITEPFFKDGIVAEAVNTVVAEGVTYFSAAGNFGSKSYENTFFPGNPPSGLTGAAHNFAGVDGDDIMQSISVDEGNYLVVLQWDDGSDFGSTTTDMDIYLANTGGTTLFGFNRVNTGGDPIEVLPFTVGPGGAEANLVIMKASGAETVRFKYIVFRGQLTMNEYAGTGSSTIVGQANAEGAIAVGAVLYSNTPEYGVDPPTVASFSSRGGTLINGVDRLKPEISGPNGVNTTVDLGGFDFEGDLFPNFFGTSAAAPHAAGLAALLFEAKSKFYNTTISPEEVREILTTTALDMGTPGYDPASGYGFLQADAALLTLANPSPLLFSLSYDTTLMPGFDTLLITIKGKYLVQGSQVYFNGEPLDSETVLYGDTAVETLVPPFSDLYPALQVYNPPGALTNGEDGGLSNSVYFTTKETLLITIDDKTKKYGEILPEFTADYSVATLNGSYTLAEAGLSPDEIARVLSIPFEAQNVTPLSNSGFWAITASASDPLNPESGIIATDSLDLALLDRYDFVFVNGFLSIENIDLLVKPQDLTLTYGEPIAGLEFDYIFNNDLNNPLNIPDEINNQILSLLQVGHATALVNGKATALVNTPAEALVNRSFMISATALVNTTDLVDVIFENPILLFDSAALVNGLATALVNGQATALVNARALVAGQATALVNGQATALVNAASLGQATALVNTTTFNATNNKESVIMLTEEDIYILAGITQGEITLISVNLIPETSVGTYWVIAGTLVTNNFNVTYEPGTITFLAAPANINILEESLTQTYSGNPITPVIATDPEDLIVDVTYNGISHAPVNAGTYVVEAIVNDANYYGSVSSNLTITPVLLNVAADNVEKTYGETDPPLTYQLTDGSLIGDDELTGELVREPGENAGSYDVLQGSISAGANYSISNFTAGNFMINPASLIVSVDTTFIYAGDPLPVFDFGFEGFVLDEDETVLSSLDFIIDPVYNGVAGIYTVIPLASAANYVITPVDGALFVNPFGPGTQQIKINILCVEVITPVNGFTHIAYFGYTNNNNTAVYIPVGADNYISSSGIFDDSGLPEVFLPEKGVFAVPFDGNLMVWAVTSYDYKGHKRTWVTRAHWSTIKCTKSEEAAKDEVFTEPQQALEIYPNPTTAEVYINQTNSQIDAREVALYDIMGNQISAPVMNISESLIRIDLSGLSAGVYIGRINHSAFVETFRVVKR